MSSLKDKEIFLVPLKDLGTWCGGGTPSKRVLAYWEDGTIPWVSPKDMKVDHIRYAEDSITEKAVEESTTNLLPSGSVLAVTRSGILRHTFPVAVTDVPVTINQDLKALVPSEGVLPKYVAFALRAFSREILNQCSKQGTTVNSIETKKLLDFQIPLYSYDLQTRIVAEIEKQISRLDEAVSNLKRVKANLKRYKAAVLKAAVEGKLTEEWRRRGGLRPPDSEGGHTQCAPTETGAELLERILEERRANWQGRGKYKEPVAPDTSGLPELPEGWVWASVEQLSIQVQYGSSAKTSEDESGVPVLRMGNIVEGALTYEDLKYLPKNHDEFPSLFLQPGDLLFNRTNSPELVGKTAVYTGSKEPCSFASYLIRVRLIKKYLAPLLAHYINSSYGRHWIKSVVTQQVGQANVNGTKLQALVVPAPPFAEQHQIVAEVERRLSVIAGAEAQADLNLRRADRLRQSILKQAFSGQLVPQNPNDEPASVLLERVRANADVGARFIAPKARPERPKRAQSIAPLRKTPQPIEPVGVIHELPLHEPPANSDLQSLDAVIAAILDHMQPGREYSRADLTYALGLSSGRWNAAIQELKRKGRVRQVGERRGTRYRLGG